MNTLTLAHAESNMTRTSRFAVRGSTMKTRRLGAVSLAVSVLLLGGTSVAAAAPPESPGQASSAVEKLSPTAAAEASLPSAPPGKAWFMVANEDRPDAAVDPETGQLVTATGRYREFVLAETSIPTTTEAGALRAEVLAAAGCGTSNFRSDPYRRWYGYPNYKYGPQAYAWQESTSGCTAYRYAFSVYLREIQPIFQPTVAKSAAYSYPGQGRVTIWVDYTGLTRCETYRSGASFTGPRESAEVRICP